MLHLCLLSRVELSQKDSRQKGVSGLGLAITKSIVERHVGRIMFGSVSGTTTFYFDLPIIKQDAAAVKSVGCNIFIKLI